MTCATAPEATLEQWWAGSAADRFVRPRPAADAVTDDAFWRAVRKLTPSQMERIEEGDWQIQAHYPGVDIRYIKGFKSKAEIDDWMAGTRRIDWLRSQGYAK